VGSASDWTKVVASDEASCGQRGDTLYCWGDNASGQVGDGSWLTQRAPTLVSGGDQSGWTSLAAVGYSGACAILSGDIYCWGQGVGPSGQTNATPVKFAAGPGWSAVFGGEWEDGCAINAGHLKCWGYDQNGMLGNGSSLGFSAAPVEVDGAYADWQTVGLGWDHGCGVRSSGLYCWGDAWQGALGVDTGGVAQQSPVLVSSDTTWTALGLGAYMSCGINNGSLYCWGMGGYLGLGDYTSRTTPQSVGGTSWTAVSCNSFHCCGIRSGGLYCWGQNNYGQVGDGTTVNALSPVRLGTDADWTAVAAGGEHSCAVRSGELSCWGANDTGQLGIGDQPVWQAVQFP
jgi:alpha-tubulin suppressor-like RCC1 family protein